MKKQLLFAGLLFGSFFSVNAQVLESSNFNGLTIGNVGTDLTGATAGQDGWYVESSNGTAPTTATNAAASNFQIVASGQTASNGLKITTSNGNKGGRYMYKAGMDDAWTDRTTGNNIIQLEYDFFTGPASASTTQNGMSIYGLDGTSLRTLAGLVYVPSTKTISGVAYLKNGATYGTYLITLGTSAIVLEDNTWYRFGVAYNTTTGAITWKGPGFENVGVNPANYAGPFEPLEVDFVSGTPTTNTAAAELTYDNYVVTATATVALLSNDDFTASKFAVYPNPSNGLVNISSDLNSSLNSVSITDLNGRTVKTVELNGDSSAQVNISDLSAGVYMMNINSDQGSTTKKIIKN